MAADLDEILYELRMQLARRGSASMNSIGKAFRIHDRDKNGVFDAEELEQLLGICGVFLKQADLHRVVRHFDRNGDGRIDYEEFVKYLTPNLNSRRKAIVRQAFEKMDRSGNGVVDVEDMHDKYSAKRNPKVLSGEKTEEEVFNEFLAVFESEGGVKDGKVTWDEFLKYYTGLSGSFPYNDDYFVTIVENAWDVKEKTAEKVSDEVFHRITEVIREKLRQKATGASSERTVARNMFKFFDLDQSGKVGFHEFKYALERFGVVADEIVLRSIFDVYDDSKSGMLTYNEFVDAILVDGQEAN